MEGGEGPCQERWLMGMVVLIDSCVDNNENSAVRVEESRVNFVRSWRHCSTLLPLALLMQTIRIPTTK